MAIESTQQLHPFTQQLLEHGILFPASSLGIYGRSRIFEDIVSQIERVVVESEHDEMTEIMRFPPVMSRRLVEVTGYMKSFPQLLGSINSFQGDVPQFTKLLHEIETGEDWHHHLTPTEVVLTPAACYPVYDVVAGTLPPGGRKVNTMSFCFRHEPSPDPIRVISFRMCEYVRIADPVTVKEWHDSCLQRGGDVLRSMGLDPILEVANDPFFGPGGRLLKASQQEQSLKFEFLAQVSGDKPTTAIASANYHQDHFAQEFGIYTADGQMAHTACVGFGLERITLALFRKHGFDVAEWPVDVRKRLWPHE